jgi:hypothetical protein
MIRYLTKEEVIELHRRALESFGGMPGLRDGGLFDSATRLETWSHALAVRQSMPELPIWLNADLAVSLDLEACYEETCRVLRIA